MKQVNIHDRFFKETFLKKEEVKDLISHFFPANIVAKLDLDSLHLDNNSYIDEELNENFSDLLYNCKFKGKVEVKISILFEHKSKQPDYPHIQILKYMIKIWESNIKQKSKLIPIIPIIIYHGEKKREHKKFESYLSGTDPSLFPFLPVFDYRITDLSDYSDDEIKKLFERVSVQISLLLMKNAYDAHNLELKIHDIFVKINSILETEEGVRFLYPAMHYLLYSIEMKGNTLIDTLKSVSLKGGEIAMTTAAQLLKEGRTEGRVEGRVEGRIETQKATIVKLFVNAGFTIEKIVEYLEIDKNFVELTLKERGFIK